MCGRFALAHVHGFWSRFGVMDRSAQLAPRFNIAPTQVAPVIVGANPSRVVMMRWGLVPFWAKDPVVGAKMINARAESVETRPAFRASFKRRRCLVPATGFFEWKKSGRTKIPYYIHMKDGSLFGFGGLYDRWRSPEGDELVTFAILTTEPNALMSEIHDRMPVIIRREDEESWLGESPLDGTSSRRFLAPFPSNQMEAYEVSTEVNSPANDHEGLIRPLY